MLKGKKMKKILIGIIFICTGISTMFGTAYMQPFKNSDLWWSYPVFMLGSTITLLSLALGVVIFTNAIKEFK